MKARVFLLGGKNDTERLRSNIEMKVITLIIHYSFDDVQTSKQFILYLNVEILLIRRK